MRKLSILVLLGLLSLFQPQTHAQPQTQTQETTQQADTLPRITGLRLTSGNFTKLNVQKCDSLNKLDCSNNQLQTLDLSANTILTYLDCSGNSLTDLDVSKNTALQTLLCEKNHLTRLDISQNEALQTLKCRYNHIPLSSLFSIKQENSKIVGDYLVLQSDTIELTGYKTFDLGLEMVIGSTETQWTLKNVDGTTAQTGTFVESDGVFRFMKKGDYALDLSNQAVHNSQGFRWIVKVKSNAHTINLQSHDTQWGEVSGGGIYEENTDVTITATAKSGYKFVNWKNDDEVFSDQAVYTFKASENLTLTAYFEAIPSPPPTQYTVSVSSNNLEWGTVTIGGSGTYEENADVTITATAKTGYKFVHWKKNDEVFSTSADTTFKATENLELTAYFESLTANEDLQEDKAFVYTRQRVICLSESMGVVQVFNMFGQCVYSGTNIKISVNTSGLYVVRTRRHTYKVMVK